MEKTRSLEEERSIREVDPCLLYYTTLSIVRAEFSSMHALGASSSFSSDCGVVVVIHTHSSLCDGRGLLQSSTLVELKLWINVPGLPTVSTSLKLRLSEPFRVEEVHVRVVSSSH